MNDMDEDQVELAVDHRSDGTYQVRALHRATGTIKISDICDSREDAISDAMEGLQLLVEERMKGLGEKKPGA